MKFLTFFLIASIIAVSFVLIGQTNQQKVQTKIPPDFDATVEKYKGAPPKYPEYRDKKEGELETTLSICADMKGDGIQRLIEEKEKEIHAEIFREKAIIHINEGGVAVIDCDGKMLYVCRDKIHPDIEAHLYDNFDVTH